MSTTAFGRHRLNFMVDGQVAADLAKLIPAGSRSSFVSNAIEQALAQFSREKAYEETMRLREQLNLKIGGDENLYKIIREGRA